MELVYNRAWQSTLSFTGQVKSLQSSEKIFQSD